MISTALYSHTPKLLLPAIEDHFKTAYYINIVLISFAKPARLIHQIEMKTDYVIQ